jgi:hypothetical protein
MANTNSPYGLRPDRLHGAAVPNESQRMYYVPASVANAIAVGDAVVKIAGSTSPSGLCKGVDLASFATNATSGGAAPITGVVTSVIGVAPAGANITTPIIPMNFGPLIRPASTSQDYYVMVADDPSTEFSVQVDSTNILPLSAIGKGVTMTYNAPSTATGWSGTVLANASVTDTDAQQFVIVGFDSVTNNSPSSAYAKVIVRLNSSTEGSGQVGI